jgi:hypothetical protein
MESLECPNALAKQVLSQLSYTPIGVLCCHFLILTGGLQPRAWLFSPHSTAGDWCGAGGTANSE